MKSLYTRLIIFSLLTLVPLAQADTTIFGLRLACEGCSNLDDRICSLSREQPEVSCEDALEFLLKRQLESGEYDGQKPSAVDLRRFLLKKDWPAKLARPALALLATTDSGQTSISNEMPRYYQKYQKEMFDLLLSEQWPKRLQLRLWQLRERDGIVLDPRLRALVAAKSLRISVGSLLESVSMSSPQKALRDLNFFSDILKDVRPEWNQVVKEVQAWIKRCGRRMAPVTDPENCSAQALDEASPDAVAFIGRFQLEYILSYLEKESLSPKEKAELLTLSYVPGREPDELADVLSDAVRDALNDPDESQLRAYTREGTLRMLFSVSERSKEVAQLVGIILNKVARDYLSRGRFYEALDIIEGSYDTFPLALRERTDLLADLISRREAQGDQETWARIEKLRKRDQFLLAERRRLEREVKAAQGIDSPPEFTFFGDSKKVAVLYAVMLLSISYLFGFVVRRRLPAPLAKLYGVRKVRPLENFEINELERILSEFGLALTASPADLHQCYRALEKELDPQFGRSTIRNKKVHMRQLKEKYQRAQSLMARRSA